MRNAFSLALSLLALAACQVSPAGITPSSPAPSSSPSAVPSPSPTLAALAAGRLLADYDFNDPKELVVDPNLSELYVVDAKSSAENQRVRGLRFSAEGRFIQEMDFALGSAGIPHTVPGMCFDLRGVGYVAHCTDKEFKLGRLIAGVLSQTDELPVSSATYPIDVELNSLNNVVTLGVLQYTGYNEATSRFLYAQAEPDELPKAIFQISPPLPRIAHMAISPGGDVYFLGSDAELQLKVVKVSPDQKMSTLPLSLPAMPDAVTMTEKQMLMAFNGASAPASLWRYDLASQAIQKSDLRLEQDSFIDQVVALSSDKLGNLFVLGRDAGDGQLGDKRVFKFEGLR